MSLWRQLARGLRVLLRRRAADQDLAEEVEHYFEEATTEFQARGLTPGQARRATRLQFGTMIVVHEQVRDHGWEHAVDTLLADLRYGSRGLRRSPAFATAATLILALGIGANTAIFSLLNDIRWIALPVPNPHELVMLTNPGAAGKTVGRTTGERDLLGYPEFTSLRDQSTSFSGLMASQADLDAVQARIDGGEAEEIRTRMVSAEYFTTLGVSAALGRVFGEDASVQGGAPYAVISYDYWQRRLGGRVDILGLTMAIRDGVFTIIGVAPRSFFGETVGQRPDVWLPLSMQATVLPGRDWLHDTPGDIAKVMWLHAFGRLKAGVTIERAHAETNTIFQRELGAYYGGVALAPDDRKAFLDQRLRLRPAATGASQIRGPFSEPLLMLLAGAALVLLIACANLGNLLLARTAAKNREISVRLALGAHRGRLVRQLLTESLLVALLGGIIGMLAALALRSGLLRLVSDSIVLPMTPDVRVLGFTFTLTLAAGLILGLLPALRATKTNAGAGLKEQGRGLTGSAAWLRVGKLVVVSQFAASLPLLVGAGLLVRTFTNLQQIDLGYSKDRLLMVRVDARTAGYGPLRRLALFEQLLDRFGLVPGIASVTYSQNGLFTEFDSGSEIVVEGYTPQGREDEGSSWDQVGAGYFSTLGVPILLGREIMGQDQQARQEVCVINEAFAMQFFDGRHPLGMHITRVFADQRNTCLVVGVARNFQARSIRGEIAPRFFVPAGSPGFYLPAAGPPGSVDFAIKTTAKPSSMIADVRHVVQQVDPNLVITSRPLTELLDEQMVQDRLLARLSMAFGVVALLLAAVGLYGVLSYAVARRTNEIGIRKALGAQHAAVIGMILRETGLLLAVGLIIGLMLSALSIRLIASRLYGLAPTDPVTFTLAVAVLAGVAFFAAWLPARRASRVDPLTALRHE